LKLEELPGLEALKIPGIVLTVSSSNALHPPFVSSFGVLELGLGRQM